MAHFVLTIFSHILCKTNLYQADTSEVFMSVPFIL